MDNSADALDDLLLELSLAAAMPIGTAGRDYIKATSAANSFANHTKTMHPGQLREMKHGVGPLLTLLVADVDDPVAGKAALGLRSLMSSRACILQFIELDGLMVISKIFQQLMNGKKIDLETPSTHRTIVEHCSACYREIARYYPWKVVRVGALRQCVTIIKYGDIVLKTLASGILAIVSQELEICKLMFTNGCVKPIILVADSDQTNEACMLAALGSIVQLCRIPEIASRVYKQGVIPLLEKALHKETGMSADSIREKALYALSYLSKADDVKRHLGTPQLLAGMARELATGTENAQLTVVEMMLSLHNHYKAEESFNAENVTEIIRLIKTGPWSTRNLCAKCLCVLYKTKENKYYLATNGAMDALIEVISSKSQDLQEAPLVALLSLLSHPNVPAMFLSVPNGVESVAQLLYCTNDIIRDLAVVFLKSLTIYDHKKIVDAVPPQRLYLLTEGIDEDIPQNFGDEYGGLIQQYLQRIVENRRDQEYLLEQLEPDDYQDLGMSKKQVRAYQESFMELDRTCKGTLDIDELQVLMVTLGEELEEYELQEILDKFAMDGSGLLTFREFLYMMKDWKNKYGAGYTKAYNDATKRGAIGRARRTFSKWWHKNAIEKEQIENVKIKNAQEKQLRKDLAAQHWDAEKIRIKRENEIKLRKNR